MDDIQLGDLCYDHGNMVLGIVAEVLDNPTYPYVIYWNNGKKNWVDSSTAAFWKSQVEKIA